MTFKSPNRRILLLLGVLLLAIAAYPMTARLRYHASADTRGLHGNASDAIDALHSLLAMTPAPERDDLLLRDAADPSPSLRYAAVSALGDSRGDRSVDAVENGFSDYSNLVRTASLETLPKLDLNRGIRLELAALRDDDTMMRETAATQLVENGRREDVPNLIAALNDPDPVVSGFAMSALRRITGQRYSAKFTDPAAKKQAEIAQWKGWWSKASRSWPVDPALAALPSIYPSRTDQAPDFDLTDIDGRYFSLSGQRGRITVLNFWGTWCPPCQAEIPDLVQLDAAYRSRNVDIVGLGVSEPNEETLRQWSAAHGIRYRQVMATDPILDAYGNIVGVPVTVIIDGRGRVRYRWDGPSDFATFSAALNRVLAAPRG